MSYKQVIIIRRDLKMRRGKEIAQGSHASSAWMVNRLNTQGELSKGEISWLYTGSTKVVLQIATLELLEELESKALNAKLLCYKITDAGKTEFNGVPTVTALAIGPNEADLIDKITGHLSLY